MNAFEQAQASLAATLKRSVGKRAVYARGPSTVSVVAIPGRTDADLVDEQNLSTRVSVDDWMIDVADLALGGVPVEPRAGDTITVDGATYRVLELGVEGAWRFTSQTRMQYRIHSRRNS